MESLVKSRKEPIVDPVSRAPSKGPLGEEPSYSASRLIVNEYVKQVSFSALALDLSVELDFIGWQVLKFFRRITSPFQ